MITLSNYFGIVADTALVSFLMLAIGAFVMSLLRQPVERIRSIEMTLMAVVTALILRQSQILPSLPVAWLQQTAAEITLETPATNVIAHALRPGTVISQPDRETFASTSNAPNLTSGHAEPAASLENRLLPSFWTTLQAYCVGIAFAGGIWRFVLWAIGRWRLTTLIRTSSPIDETFLAEWSQRREAARRHVRFRLASRLDVPLTCGILRPVIIVPASFLRSDAQEQLYSCLTHEWSHIENRDAFVWFLVRVLEPIVWFQPFFWRLKRELRVCQDQLADQSVVSASGDRISYAELLAALARGRAMSPAIPALSMTDRPSHLRRRIEMLLSESQAIRFSARPAVTATIVFALTMSAVLLAMIGSKSAAAIDKPVDVAPTAKAAEPLSYSGMIVDAKTKKPLGGVDVRVRLRNHTGPNSRVVGETTHKTHPDGKFDFVITPEQVAEPRLYVELRLQHPGYVTQQQIGYSLAMIRKNAKLGEPPFFTQLTMRRSDPVTGRIVDPQRQPLADVAIRGYTSSSKQNLNGGKWPTTKSGADGRFSIEAVEGGPAVIGIVPEKYAPVQLVLDEKHGDQGDIRVEDGISLRGLVLDAQSNPVKGVWVNVYDQTEEDKIKMPVVTSVSRSYLTDAQGRFELGPLKPDVCELRIEGKASEAGVQSINQNPVPINDVFLVKKFDLSKVDKGLPMTVDALPYVNARGRFVDSQGKPTTGWDISVSGQIGDEWYFARWEPNDAGVFEGKLPRRLKRAQFDAISNEHHALRARLRKGEPLKLARDFKLGEIDSDLPEIEIVKFVAPIVQILVEDESGRPIKGAKVAGLYDNGDETETPTATNIPTNVWFEQQADGAQRTEQMVPDVKTTFTAHADGYEDASETLTLPEKAERKITLKLKKESGKPKS